MIIFNSISNLFFLSVSTIMFGYILDFTISKESILYYMKYKPELYVSGIQASFFNLLVLSPINYLIAINNLITKDFFFEGIIFKKLILMLLCHNLLYLIFHFMVHKIEILKPIHLFHHKLNNLLILNL